MNDGNTQEELLIDFNLSIGDTLTGRYCSAIIAGIDSVLVGSSYRKRFLTSMAREIVEGIGDVSYAYSGPFYACPCACTQVWRFSCFIQNGNVIYGDPNCSPVSSVQNITEDVEAFHLFPNPATNELQIRNLSFKIEGIEIYDVLGQLQMQGISDLPDLAGQKSQNFSMNISRLSAGIYFLCMKNGKERVVRKFIKQ